MTPVFHFIVRLPVVGIPYRANIGPASSTGRFLNEPETLPRWVARGFPRRSWSLYPIRSAMFMMFTIFHGRLVGVYEVDRDG